MSDARGLYSPEQEEAIRFQVKAEIRKRIVAVRRALPAEARASRAKSIAQHVLELPEVQTAHVVLSYVAYRGEADPRPITDELARRGTVIALPRVEWPDETLAFREMRPGSDLEESGLGFLQPPESARVIAAHEIDVVLVPTVAADERGFRIGSGKGFYDRALPSMTRAVRVALLYDFQLVPEVPNTEFDVPVHVIATDASAQRAL